MSSYPKPRGCRRLNESGYAFGDSEVAAKRLRLVAEVFEPEIRSFLARVPASPRLAVDLGCGPGYTTRLVAGLLGPERTVGLDTSSRFIEMAAAEPITGVEYLQHDVTDTAFPVGPADLMFCHLLLPHLRGPEKALATWADQLQRGSLLIVDEVADIRTSEPVFRRYLQMVETVVAAQGGELYAGRVVERLDPILGLRKASSQLVELPVSTANAAAMFRMNLAVWGGRPSARASVPTDGIAKIGSELDELTTSRSEHKIVWLMRQVTYEASPSV